MIYVYVCMIYAYVHICIYIYIQYFWVYCIPTHHNFKGSSSTTHSHNFCNGKKLHDPAYGKNNRPPWTFPQKPIRNSIDEWTPSDISWDINCRSLQHILTYYNLCLYHLFIIKWNTFHLYTNIIKNWWLKSARNWSAIFKCHLKAIVTVYVILLPSGYD